VRLTDEECSMSAKKPFRETTRLGPHRAPASGTQPQTAPTPTPTDPRYRDRPSDGGKHGDTGAKQAEKLP
jgi:hypothetical protein